MHHQARFFFIFTPSLIPFNIKNCRNLLCDAEIKTYTKFKKIFDVLIALHSDKDSL